MSVVLKIVLSALVVDGVGNDSFNFGLYHDPNDNKGSECRDKGSEDRGEGLGSVKTDR